MRKGCFSQCKDTNFKANHNYFKEINKSRCVVLASAKILILKQITTRHEWRQVLQRCFSQCKDTNFKANHNYKGLNLCHLFVVLASAKILILKQITTIEDIGIFNDSLF